jgi:hypothetical protein
MGFAHASYSKSHSPSRGCELQTIRDQVDDDLKYPVLISVQDHILKSTETERPQVAECIWSSVVVQIVLVHAFELDGQLDTTFLGLLVEDCEDLLADVAQPELFLIKAELLADLVLAAQR